MGKRTMWIAEVILGIIAGIALFLSYEQIATACVVAIAATMNNLVSDKPE